MLNKINISLSKQKLIIVIILVIVTLAVYWQVNQFEFINFDDDIYIIKNNHIQPEMSLDGIRWAFGTEYLPLWMPIVWLSLMLDYQLFGLNAGGYHVTNLIFHILSTLLLFWLICRMTQKIWKGAFVAAFFALHPLHVESVAWITERKDVLSAFFWMLTLYLYVYYTEKPIIRRYLFVIFAFILALMSKPMVVTLPIIMILFDYWPLARFEAQKNKTSLFLWQIKEKFPLFVLSIIIVIITLYNTGTEKDFLSGITDRFGNALVSFAAYLAKTLWPQDLAVFYPFPAQISILQVIGATFFIIVISFIIIFMAKRLPYLFVGWLWYAITIVPVIGIIAVGDHAMADRYHYLSSVGIAIMLAWGIPSLFPREDTCKKILFPIGIGTIIILAILTWQQCSYWKNNYELWSHAVKVTKNNFLAHNQLAIACFDDKKYEEALYHYNEAIRMFPHYAEAYNNRGNIYAIMGQHQRAIEDYDKAISIKPNIARIYKNRGKTEILSGNREDGCRDAQKACALGDCRLIEHSKDKGICR